MGVLLYPPKLSADDVLYVSGVYKKPHSGHAQGSCSQEILFLVKFLSATVLVHRRVFFFFPEFHPFLFIGDIHHSPICSLNVILI